MSGIGPIPVLLVASSPSGTPLVVPTMTMGSDGLSANGTVGIVVGSFEHVYDPTVEVWNRTSSGSAAADALVPDAIGNVRVLSQVMGYNGANFDRVRALDNDADALPTQIGNLCVMNFGYGYNGATFDRLRSIGSNTDGVPPEATGQQAIAAQLYGWNGASFDRVRLANISHTVVATGAGATAVWTPTAGKKFRLLGYTIDVAGTLAATGVQTIQLQDDATTFKNHLAEVIETTTVSISNSTTNIGADLGQGYLSTAVNNVLNIVLGTAMTSGGVAINVWGTEE